jgi:nitrous oxidase accessory protein NosD
VTSGRALLCTVLVAAAIQGAAAQQVIPLTQGMVIDRSITIRPGTYRLSSRHIEAPVITIRGEGITVDFNGAVLVGGPEEADPDSYTGTGVLIDGGRGITVKNATVRGYKVGILARRSPRLHLTHNDLSFNWKQRLRSGIEKESLVDWMSYHQNDKDEWLRFGAAIYLSECDDAEMDHNTAVQGQNGLMVTRSSGLKIWNNTFQYLSSLGVGFYRVTKTSVMHNRIDWNVRGYSHGYYNRGQDSAGLLMYEQSSDNVVAFNSITHGGDGLFLWAGQSTMDTGKGGSNDNLFYRNDFSHAPTNGIEATFSRNRFIENRIDDCWHGVWGGYSFDSVWHGNRFARNAEAIAIEHGQNNEISSNTFEGDRTAIRLWQNPSQEPDWGYPKARDTRSRAYRIEQNRFRNTAVALDLRDTTGVQMWLNRFQDVGEMMRRQGDTSGLVDLDEPPGMLMMWTDEGMPSPLPAGMDAMLPDGARRGRETITVDEWGPYDWKSPKLWPVAPVTATQPLPYSPAPGPLPVERVSRLRVLGPPGAWRVASVRGAIISPQSGRVGDTVAVTPNEGATIDWHVALEYRGQEVTSPRGARTAAGQPYRFEYRRFVPAIDWDLQWFEYTDATHPVDQPDAFRKLLEGKPVVARRAQELHYLTGRSVEEGLPRDRVALRAEGDATLPPGHYTLEVISDDGVRVWMDGTLVLDAWAPHGSREDTVAITGGRRHFRVEYYELGGFAELRFRILPGP